MEDGSAYKSHLDKIQIKQNDSARLIFFATAYGEHTESALTLLNLLDILTVNNVYLFQILKFTHLWYKGLFSSSFSTYFRYASSIHNYDTRYSLQDILIQDFLHIRSLNDDSVSWALSLHRNTKEHCIRWSTIVHWKLMAVAVTGK